jgi:hypothetical protein
VLSLGNLIDLSAPALAIGGLFSPWQFSQEYSGLQATYKTMTHTIKMIEKKNPPFIE